MRSILSYKTWCVAAAALFAAVGGCSKDTGILVSVARPAQIVSVDQLQFVSGVMGAAGSNVYVQNAADPNVTIDVAGRDLAAAPYKLLFRDSAGGQNPVQIMVAVIATAQGQPVGFAAFDLPQPFVPGAVVQIDLMLQPLTSNTFTTRGGCIIFNGITIAPADNPTCNAPSCVTASDCDKNGPPPCGTYQCNGGACQVICPNCTDADKDGYGVGAGCAGGDCNDADPAINIADKRACYDGPSNTEGVGVCHGGSERCVTGNWGPCLGEQVPSGESCNGLDDDCNGIADDGLPHITCGTGACTQTVQSCVGGAAAMCTPKTALSPVDLCTGADDNCDGIVNGGCTCIHVALAGDDNLAASTDNATPFLTIQAAVNWAVANPSKPRVVCVAAGAACAAIGTYTGVNLMMANGVHVYGNYESTTWTRCPTSKTTLMLTVPEGVVFGTAISGTTILDGFDLRRVQTATSSVAAVTVMGGKGAVIQNVSVTDAPLAPITVGVSVTNNGDATVTSSLIQAGGGTMLAAGVRAQDSHVVVTGNCAHFDGAGRCTGRCPDNATLSIHGAVTAPAGMGTGSESYAVLLERSGNSRVETSLLCDNFAAAGAAVRVKGDGGGILIQRNTIQGQGGATDSYGVWVEDCNDGAPRIADNAVITAGARNVSARVAGVRAVGGCHPVIDGNVSISADAEGTGIATTHGVWCAANTSKGPSRCVVSASAVFGSQLSFPATSTAVRCDAGACARIDRNQLDGHGGTFSFGLQLNGTGTFVDRNRVTGGCPMTAATGIQTNDAWARLQNNVVFGGDCGNGTISAPTFVGLVATLGDGLNELDVHSNDIDGGGALATCSASAVHLTGASPAGGAGIFRNNIFRASFCSTRIVFKEETVTADPRIVENNDFDPTMGPQALYVDEAMIVRADAAAINAMSDAKFTANISADPQYLGYPNDLHVAAASMCIGAGTPAGAPAYDFDGAPRASTPTIGALEQ
jgi:hypothetical protein